MPENNNSAWVVLGFVAAAFIGWEVGKSQQSGTRKAKPPAGSGNANAGATTLSDVGIPSSGTTAPSLINPGGYPMTHNPDLGGYQQTSQSTTS
jgi:hypothetical protein